MRRKPSSVKGNSEAAAVRKIVKRSDPKAMSSAIQELPTIDSTDRRHFLFYQDEGGLRATDEANQAMDIIYYLGVIDILTPYNTVKRLEHMWRGATIDRVSSGLSWKSITKLLTPGLAAYDILCSAAGIRGAFPQIPPVIHARSRH